MTAVAWADCTSPAGTAGKVVFDDTDASMQYCNGAAWIKFPKVVPPSGWKQVSTGKDWSDSFACGVANDGHGYCWGTDTNARLGNGAALTAMQTTPSLIAGGHKWKQISAGELFVCGIRTDDVAMCWGRDDFGQLGNGATTGDQPEPVLVTGGHLWSSISTGWIHACGVRTDGVGMCWGDDSSGRLGNGAGGATNSPGVVTGSYSWANISSGNEHSCGATTTGVGYCWGNAASGRLGNSTTTPNMQDPSPVSGGHTWRSITTGNGHSCGTLTDGSAYCWGSSWQGKLGNGTTSPDVSSPSLVLGGHDFQYVQASLDMSCGLTTGNIIYCWGADDYGSLGTAGFNQSTPTILDGGHSWSGMGLGGYMNCAVRTDGEAMCWGNASTGGLGNGTTTPNQYAPVLVGDTTSACTLGTASTSTAYDGSSLNDIIFANGKFWITGYDGVNHVIMNSSDGITWSSSNISGPFQNIAYGNGRYVAVQTYWNNDSMTSTDGVTWNTHNNAITFAAYDDIEYGNGTFIAAGDAGLIASTDGIAWGAPILPGGESMAAVAYGNGRFVAVSLLWNCTNCAAVSTNNGASWTANAGPGGNNNGIVFGKGLFVTVAYVGEIRTSPDGVTWTTRTSGTTADLFAITYANGRFVVGAADGTYLTSTDGITWTSASGGPSGNAWGGIAYGNGKFIAASWGDWGGEDTERLLYIPCLGECINPVEPAGSIIYNDDRRVMQWCDGTSWHSMGPDNPGGASGGCSNPAGTAGNILYNSSYNIPQYCDGGTWRAVGPLDPCMQSGATPGTRCLNGTIYAGLSPDGNVKMFTTPADAVGIPWNNGNFTGQTYAGQTSFITGLTNTDNLIGFDADSIVGGVQPHQAATICDSANDHGNDDWYLPARDELNVLYANRMAIGGFNLSGSYPAGMYWSSSESNANEAVAIRFSDGVVDSGATKSVLSSIRCVRK